MKIYIILLLALTITFSCNKPKTEVSTESNVKLEKIDNENSIVGEYHEQAYKDHLQKIIQKDDKFFISFYNPIKKQFVSETELLEIKKSDYNKFFGDNSANVLKAYKVKNGYFVVTPKMTVFSTSMGKSQFKDGYALVTDISMPLVKKN